MNHCGTARVWVEIAREFSKRISKERPRERSEYAKKEVVQGEIKIL